MNLLKMKNFTLLMIVYIYRAFFSTYRGTSRDLPVGMKANALREAVASGNTKRQLL